MCYGAGQLPEKVLAGGTSTTGAEGKLLEHVTAGGTSSMWSWGHIIKGWWQGLMCYPMEREWIGGV